MILYTQNIHSLAEDVMPSTSRLLSNGGPPALNRMPRLHAKCFPACLPRRKSEHGATLVEFALIVMLFMVMVLGIIEFSRALYAYHYVSNMARDATRWAAVNGSTCTDDGSCLAPATGPDIVNYVANHVPMGLNPTLITTVPNWVQQPDSPAICGPTATNPTPPPPFTAFIDNYPGCTVEVQVIYQFNFLFPLVHSAVLPVSSTSAMVIAH